MRAASGDRSHRAVRGRVADREQPDLDDFLHGLADGDLAEAQVVADLGDGRAGAGRDDDLPRVRRRRRLSGRGSSADSVTHTSIDGTTASISCHSMSRCSASRISVLDIARRARLGRRDVGLEDEAALTLAEQLEDDRDGRVARLGVVRRREDDAAAVEPDVADAAIASDAQAAGLVRRRERAERRRSAQTCRACPVGPQQPPNECHSALTCRIGTAGGELNRSW